MKTPIFTGAAVAIITPMLPDGSVDYKGLADLIEFQIKGGTDAVVICGTTGESATLKDDEHLECIRVAVETAAGRIPVIAGTGSNYTEHAVEMSKEAKARGADALLLVTPYYNKTTQAGLIQHFSYVADRVSVPMILYNVPSRTGIGINPATYKALSAHPNINGVKEASGNIAEYALTRSMCGDELVFWSGNDSDTVPMMALGAVGVISVASNIIPADVAKLCELCLAGDFQAAAAAYFRLAAFFGCGYIVSSIGEAHLADQAVASNEVVAEHIRALVPELEKYGLTLVLETHGDHGSGKILKEIVDRVGSPRVGINYDTANALFYGNVDLGADLDASMDAIRYMHLKDKGGERTVWDFPALGKGWLDFPLVFDKLAKAGNDCPFSIEIEFTQAGAKDLAEINQAVKDSAEYLTAHGFVL